MTSTIYNRDEFYVKPFFESLFTVAKKLTGASSSLLEILNSSCIYPDKVYYVPPVKELAEILERGESTVYAALKKIKESCPYLRIQNNSTWIAVYRTDPENPKNFFDYQNQECVPIHKNKFLEYRKRFQNQENETPKPLPDEGFKTPNTLNNLNTPHTEEEVEKKNKEQEQVSNEEVEVSEQEADDQLSAPLEDSKKIETHEHIVNEEVKPPPVVAQNKHKIPQDLLERLEEEEVEKKNKEQEQVSNEEVEVSEQEADDQLSAPLEGPKKIETHEHIVNEEVKAPPVVAQNKHKIPQDLLERLEMAGVKTSEQVLVKISQHDMSQACGAITHVENTFETIKDPTAIFLYQLPKQPIEKMGCRHDEEVLLKLKADIERINREIEQGRPSFSQLGFGAIKQKLLEQAAKHKKNGSPRMT